MANEGYHEAITDLSDETRDMNRAITSLMVVIDEIVAAAQQYCNPTVRVGENAMVCNCWRDRLAVVGQRKGPTAA